MKKSWVIYKGGYEKHARRRGPGRVPLNAPRGSDPLATQEERAATFDPHAPDAPKKASRTRPASWGR